MPELISGEGLDTSYQPPREEFIVPDYPPLQFDYKGFDCRWTGWKFSAENIHIAGQWVAFGEDSIVGVCLPHMKVFKAKKGESFHFPMPVGAYLETFTKESRLDLIERGRRKLLEAIDALK